MMKFFRFLRLIVGDIVSSGFIYYLTFGVFFIGSWSFLSDYCFYNKIGLLAFCSACLLMIFIYCIKCFIQYLLSAWKRTWWMSFIWRQLSFIWRTIFIHQVITFAVTWYCLVYEVFYYSFAWWHKSCIPKW